MWVEKVMPKLRRILRTSDPDIAIPLAEILA